MMETKHVNTRSQYFGLFLQRSLKRSGVSRQQFARNLRLEPATVDALLGGAVPAGHISDDLLVAIALQVDLDPEVLRLALGWVKLGSLPNDEIDTAPADTRATQEAIRQTAADHRLELDDVRVTLGAFVAAANCVESQPARCHLQPVLKTLQSFMEQCEVNSR